MKNLCMQKEYSLNFCNSHNICFPGQCQGNRKGGSRKTGSLENALALAEGLAVGTLVNGGIGFMGTHQNPVQRAVILAFAVVRALMDGAFNALVGMTIHCCFLLLFGFGHSMAERAKGILEKVSKLAFPTIM